VYQGHHGDIGAQLADVCLPSAAYTEKSSIWINTEGRSQLGRAAVPPPGSSREDWKIIRYDLQLYTFVLLISLSRALSEVIGQPLPYDETLNIRDRLWEISPSLVRFDVTEPTSADMAALGLSTLSNGASKQNTHTIPFRKPILNFYQTDVISRAYVVARLPLSCI
jgi:NADH dehydrogenase (ubiquinone) Fe-S protein 1